MSIELQPEYFAVRDPLDSTKMTYWYRSKRGRAKGKLQPWPPRRAQYAPVLYRKDLPDRRIDPDRYQAVVDHFMDRVRLFHRGVREEINQNPDGCAALFSELQSRCCCCGKGLTDERSKVYGIGPECRQGVRADVLSALIDRVAREHGRSLEVFASGRSPL